MRSTRARRRPRRHPATVAGGLSLLALWGLLAGCQMLQPSAWSTVPESEAHPFLLRIAVTGQRYAFHRPWEQRQPATRRTIGVLLPDGKVLATARPLADARHIELEKIGDEAKCRAAVTAIDYEADLALLTCGDADFLAGMKAVDVAARATPGDRLQLLQAEPRGRVPRTPVVLNAVELKPYPHGNHFLVYRLNGVLQRPLGHATLPVRRGRRLVGLLKTHDRSTQSIDLIPAPLIQHFLADAANGRYDGFPLSGVNYTATEDPQLRRFLGLKDVDGGVLLEKVFTGSAAARAGLKSGDVLLAIDGQAVTSRGEYSDPLYGRLPIGHLIRCGYQVGDTVRFDILRDGKRRFARLTLARRTTDDYLVPPYVHDRPPRYYILGGLVFQELTVPYLQDYGKDWTLKAPVHLLYFHRHQFDLPHQPGDKVVLLSSILPTAYTDGYEMLRDIVVTRINGRKIRRLDDIPAALARDSGPFYRIELDRPPGVIFLDPAEIPEIDRQVQKRYHVPQLVNLGAAP